MHSFVSRVKGCRGEATCPQMRRRDVQQTYAPEGRGGATRHVTVVAAVGLEGGCVSVFDLWERREGVCEGWQC